MSHVGVMVAKVTLLWGQQISGAILLNCESASVCGVGRLEQSWKLVRMRAPSLHHRPSNTFFSWFSLESATSC